MDIMTLMAQFADPESLNNLSLIQKVTASLITTLLGMGITFLSLIILQCAIGLLARFSGAPAPVATEQVQITPQKTSTATTAATTTELEDQRCRDEELVAAITVALSLHLGTAAGTFRIRNIHRIEDHLPAWNRAGLAELMNNNVG